MAGSSEWMRAFERGGIRGVDLQGWLHQEEILLIRRALRYVGWPRHPMPGYYEFMVWDRERLLFRNYQPPGSGFATLERHRSFQELDGD